MWLVYKLGIVLAWGAVMVHLGRELLEHQREGRRGNVVTTAVFMGIVSAAAFVALFWWLVLFWL